MRTGRVEALDMFRKWASDGSEPDKPLVLCDFSFGSFAARFRVRVLTVADDRVVLASDDRETELVLLISESLEFRYVEPEEAGDPADIREFVCGLAAFFPAPDGVEQDRITFCEFR
jgi:hypothetical protein